MLFGYSPLTDYLRQYEGIYPGIELWWERRVVPDMANGIKVIFRFDRGLEIQALGVIDLQQAKLCHLSLEHAVRGSGLAQSIMKLAKGEIRSNGHTAMWCHGPETMVQQFAKWAGAEVLAPLGTFGRLDVKDVEMTIPLIK